MRLLRFFLCVLCVSCSSFLDTQLKFALAALFPNSVLPAYRREVARAVEPIMQRLRALILTLEWAALDRIQIVEAHITETPHSQYELDGFGKNGIAVRGV